jgi:peroxiredoxin
VKNFFIIGLFLLTFLVPVQHIDAIQADQSPSKSIKEIYDLFSQGEYEKALQLTESVLKNKGPANGRLEHMKYNLLMKLHKYDNALTFIDNLIKKRGESEEFLSAKFNILFQKGDLNEALKTAMKKDKISPRKSPWNAMNMVHVYIRMRSANDALDWLQEAVSRGFISFRLLADEKYALIQQQKRFLEIIESIKISIGLGLPAKNFAAKRLSGKGFTLSELRGRVILVVFWATWCEPCRHELPMLNRYYEELKDKGFEIVAVSLDTDPGKTKQFVQQHKLNWNHTCSGKKWADPAVKQYGVNSVPSYWLIDKKGYLRSVDLKGQELKKAITQLLEEK